MANSFFISTLCAIFAFFTFPNAFSGQITQFTTVFEERDCKGNALNFTKTTYNITNNSGSYVSNGLWMVGFLGQTSFDPRRYGDQYCSNSRAGEVKWVSNFYPFDFDDPALMVSEKEFFYEPTHVLSPNDAIRFFNSAITIGSWVLTGNDSYILYSSTGLNATSICVQPDPATKIRGYGMEWGSKLTIIVQYIQRVPFCPPVVKKAQGSTKSVEYRTV